MGKKQITITLYMSELIYDVQNKTYLTGRSRDDGKNDAEVANMKANDDEENSNQIVRTIGNSFSYLKTKLSEYIDNDKSTTASNIISNSTANLVVTLDMPSNYNTANNDAVALAMHKYIVNTSLMEWFNITNKNDAKEYSELAVMSLNELAEAINKRTRPTRTEVTQ